MQRKICYNGDMDSLWNKSSLQIYKALDGQVRLVGGCIRDYLLRRPVHDRDMATPLPPEEVESALKKANIDFISVGKKYGTISAKMGGELYEITTLRKETKHDGRYAEMTWTTSYKTDALRRDFTVNALSADVKNKIFDYTTGRSDLAQGLVRFIGDPEKRIQEDYLRILRYFRFWSAISPLALDPAVVQICKKHKKDLEILSVDRIRDEMFRLICTPRAEEALMAMKKAGLLIPKIIEITFSKKQLDILKEKSKLLEKVGFTTFKKGGKNDNT